MGGAGAGPRRGRNDRAICRVTPAGRWSVVAHHGPYPQAAPGLKGPYAVRGGGGGGATAWPSPEAVTAATRRAVCRMSNFRYPAGHVPGRETSFPGGPPRPLPIRRPSPGAKGPRAVREGGQAPARASPRAVTAATRCAVCREGKPFYPAAMCRAGRSCYPAGHSLGKQAYLLSTLHHAPE